MNRDKVSSGCFIRSNKTTAVRGHIAYICFLCIAMRIFELPLVLSVMSPGCKKPSVPNCIEKRDELHTVRLQVFGLLSRHLYWMS